MRVLSLIGRDKELFFTIFSSSFLVVGGAGSVVQAVIEELKEFGCLVDVADSWADKDEVKHEYGLDLVDNFETKLESYDALVLAVSHDVFKKLKIGKQQIVYDIKSALPCSDGRL